MLTLATAESATGGRIADRLTDVPGSSDYFHGAITAYSNEAKSKTLGVKGTTLKTYGAVSSQTAIEMAEGGRKALNVSLCISSTGIAGPAGATPEKPVGLFYLGLASEDRKAVEEHYFAGDREENKESAVKASLALVKQYLLTLA